MNEDNGWQWNGETPSWAEFKLQAPVTLTAIKLWNGVNRNDHRLTGFKVTVKSGGVWQDLEGVMVNGGVVAADGAVTLSFGIWELDMAFDTVLEVTDIKLAVTATDTPNQNGMVNELVPVCTLPSTATPTLSSDGISEDETTTVTSRI